LLDLFQNAMQIACKFCFADTNCTHSFDDNVWNSGQRAIFASRFIVHNGDDEFRLCRNNDQNTNPPAGLGCRNIRSLFFATGTEGPSEIGYDTDFSPTKLLGRLSREVWE
jgi:hypothetical protein